MQQFKALTIHQPYASAIMLGEKIYETRSWYPPQRIEKFVLHGGRTFVQSAQVALKQYATNWPDEIRLARGAALGIVRIVEVYNVGDLRDDIDELELELGNWLTGYAWEIEVVKIFDTPIAARGQQGFWNIQLPPNITDTHHPQIHME